ncbi:MAG TPA: hypothetical protein VLF79_01720 [Candidatus Saccharimonadales bacterium]|nr:hypothetical protein [Candidatus Saccharimonadales bacterium]
MNEINRESRFSDRQLPALENWKLIGDKVCGAVIGHPKIEDGKEVSFNVEDVTLPAHSETPYLSATEAPDLLRAGVELRTSQTLYHLGQENPDLPKTPIPY